MEICDFPFHFTLYHFNIEQCQCSKCSPVTVAPKIFPALFKICHRHITFKIIQVFAPLYTACTWTPEILYCWLMLRSTALWTGLVGGLTVNGCVDGLNINLEYFRELQEDVRCLWCGWLQLLHLSTLSSGFYQYTCSYKPNIKSFCVAVPCIYFSPLAWLHALIVSVIQWRPLLCHAASLYSQDKF